jgi:hypothetical protein
MNSSIDPHDPVLRHHATEIVTRAAAVVGLAGVGVIHLLDSIGEFEATPYMGWVYIGLIIGCLATGAALVRGNFREAWIAAAVLPLSAIVGFTLTRTTGLPQATGDVGNWTEPLGLAALYTEGVLVAIAGYALVALRPVALLAKKSRGSGAAVSAR